ncbi:hypothetical protein BD779DRAFT_1671423 [Infundibulicybe gibba]|nr:hypothetical protein BD779DRAFT_1671423 [Infundibulicybe gibba]
MTGLGMYPIPSAHGEPAQPSPIDLFGTTAVVGADAGSTPEPSLKRALPPWMGHFDAADVDGGG